MFICFYKNNNFAETPFYAMYVENINEMRDVLKEEFAKYETKKFMYCWEERTFDGSDKPEYVMPWFEEWEADIETDEVKMLDKITDWFEKCGECWFTYAEGKAIWIYNDEAYDNLLETDEGFYQHMVEGTLKTNKE